MARSSWAQTAAPAGGMMPAEVPGSTSALSASALVGIAAADGADGAADGAPDAAHAAADVVSSVLRPIAHNSGITRTGERPREGRTWDKQPIIN